LIEYESRKSVDIRGIAATGEEELIQRPGAFKIVDSRRETAIVEKVQFEVTVLKVSEQ